MFFKLKKSAPIASEETDRSIALQGHRVDYKLIRRRGRRGVGLKVDGNGMTVAVSLSTPISVAEKMIGDNANWVLKKLDEWSHRRIVPQTWQTGIALAVMGETLTLMIDVETKTVRRKPAVEQMMQHRFVRGQVV